MIGLTRRNALSALFLALFAGGMTAFAPAMAASEGFFRSIEDLPLAPGFAEAVEEGVEFDSPTGRIVTATAYGDGEIGMLRAFYQKALPALGWAEEKGDSYRREGESLILRFGRANGRVSVRVRLVPGAAKKSP